MSIIPTMSAEELWKIYTYFILKLFRECHPAQQKPTGTLLRGQQAEHRALQDAQPEHSASKGFAGPSNPPVTPFSDTEFKYCVIYKGGCAESKIKY